MENALKQVVQAKCPYCKNMLRIPGEWLNLPMKCKHCLHIFQTKPRFEPPHKIGFWKKSLVFGLILALIGGVAIFTQPYLSALFSAQENAKNDPKQIAVLISPQGDPAKKDSPPVKLVPRDEPKKEDPPKVIGPKKKIDPPKKKDPDPIQKKKPTVEDKGPYPRRALLINVSNYLLFNPLHFGYDRTPKYPGSNIGVLADTLNRPPLNIPATQITELSDFGKKAFATTKEVIENAVKDFAQSARAQDHIIILFTGHAISIEKEAYLVPAEGNRDDAKTLIPLAWVYDQLAKCQARQKLLILDVYRFPPVRGEELPGAGEMTEEFVAKLLNPPRGIQVWSSCGKGQQSIELEAGSVFIQALCFALQDGPHPLTSPGDPLPMESLVSKVNDKLKKTLAPQKLDQISRLTGSHDESAGSPFNPAEPLPPKLVLKAITPSGGAGADPAVVKDILAELNRLPPVRATQKPVPFISLPLFSAKALEEYQSDYKSWPELVDMAKDKAKYPLRAGVLEAIQVLRASEKIKMEEKISSPITPQLKIKFFAEQKEPGIQIFEMENALMQLRKAGAKRDQETSKRWQAHYDYALARLQARLVYVYEYNNILALVRGDNLPDLEPFHTGWRVGSIKKVQISEPKVKDMVKNIQKTWKRIEDENPGTPWAILAARENMMALGLVWRASRD